MGTLSIWLPTFLLVVLCVSNIDGRPMKRGPPPPRPVEAESPDDEKTTGLAYDVYLRQVVDVLESDPDFRKRLETANVSDIKSGKIAMYLELVNHTIRTSLDEIKRREVTRLQDLARMQMMEKSANARKDFDIPTNHLDVRNPHSFEMKDLEALIKKTTSDLEELDKKRREDFKEYEMEKEFEKQDHLKKLSEEEKKKEQERLEELKKKHQEHPKLNHPGSKDQFEEVWDKVDNLEDQDFNPKTFFFKHDLNGDMEWSIDEVDAVLRHELDKVYDEKNSPDEDDPREREEEMAKMREHVFQEMDKDKNFRISFQEFIDYTGSQGESEHFKEDPGWKAIGEDEDPAFSDDEYMEYLKSHHAQPGVVDNPPDLQFKSEHELNQPQHQQGNQQQVQQNQQQQQNQQAHQQPPQQQQNQQAHQQPPQQQQNQQAHQQPPQQQQQHPNQVNMNQMPPGDQQDLQKQLKELQEKLNQQQQQQHQQQQQQQQQQHQQQQQPQH